MPLTTAQTDADLAAMLADLPDTLTMGAQTVAAARHWPASVVFEQLRAAYGREYVASVSSRSAAWTTAPVIGDIVTYSGDTRRVLEVETSPDGVQVVLHRGSQYGRGRG